MFSMKMTSGLEKNRMGETLIAKLLNLYSCTIWTCNCDKIKIVIPTIVPQRINKVFLTLTPQGRKSFWNHLVAEKSPRQLHQQSVVWSSGSWRCHCGKDWRGDGQNQGDSQRGFCTAATSQLNTFGCLPFYQCMFSLRLLSTALPFLLSKVKKNIKKVRVTVKPHLLFRVRTTFWISTSRQTYIDFVQMSQWWLMSVFVCSRWSSNRAWFQTRTQNTGSLTESSTSERVSPSHLDSEGRSLASKEVGECTFVERMGIYLYILKSKL